jgi:RNA polymerase sigma factor (sigma-70 family)
VLVIRSKDIGIIGVGEGSTPALSRFLHEYLGLNLKKFFAVEQPTWKVGLRFLWGTRPYFNFLFSYLRITGGLAQLPRIKSYYCWDEMEYEDPLSVLMSHDRVFERSANGDARTDGQGDAGKNRFAKLGMEIVSKGIKTMVVCQELQGYFLKSHECHPLSCPSDATANHTENRWQMEVNFKKLKPATLLASRIRHNVPSRLPDSQNVAFVSYQILLESVTYKISCHLFGSACHSCGDMMTTRMMSVAANNDVELVSESLSGNRDAFGQIVARYQSLVCSLAFSATGSLSQSEDLAQETFITAWKQLAGLREPEKLRAWLCGIARNLINNSLRRQGREPSHRAESLEEISETHSLEPLPAEQAISNEEAAILWRSLERIPEIYREPLVLFYREHQSIEAVAQNLDLSEDAVKQRLSRGRKLLHEQVLAFVEGALERTNPGKIFTIGVLAALPAAIVTSAKAATLAAAAKGGAGMKAAGTMGLLGVLLSPLMILFGNFIPYRIGLAEARTDEERRHLKSYFGKIWAWSFALSFVPLTVFWLTLENHQPGSVKTLGALMLWFLSFIVVYLLTVISFGAVTARQRREYLS